MAFFIQNLECNKQNDYLFGGLQKLLFYSRFTSDRLSVNKLIETMTFI